MDPKTLIGQIRTEFVEIQKKKKQKVLSDKQIWFDNSDSDFIS